jgi:hypothetical protein
MRLEMNGLGESGRAHAEQAMMVLRSLERAITGLWFLEENAVSTRDFRDLFPFIWDELNKAEYYLRILNNSSSPRPMLLHN